jgi:phenylacetate-CoA ligase
MLSWLSGNVFFPLWEIKNGGRRRHYLRDLRKTQWWSLNALKGQQMARLAEICAYAFQNCPYYTRKFSESGFNGFLSDERELKSLPVLNKADIRNHLDDLVSTKFSAADLVESKTGGSTGVALKLYFDRQCQELRNSAAMRSDEWAGWELGAKVAAIWGNPPIQTTIKERIRNRLLERTFYLDTMNVNDASVRSFIDRWRIERPSVVFGHAHSIYILAAYLDNWGVTDLRPRGIVTTSMMLLDPERRVIERVFGCKCTNRYGCEEVSLIACECERHEGLHLNIDHVFVEFLRDDGTDAEPGEDANIVVTDLINRGMPLIRYRVEDRGVLSDRACSCGRGLPLMERVTGRQADFLKRADGSLVAGVSLVERTLTAVPGIQQMQLVQDRLDHVCAKVVAGLGYSHESAAALDRELKSVFGVATVVEIERVEALAQTSSGKYRFAICSV